MDLDVDGEPARDRTYLAVSVPLARLRSSLYLSDGRLASAAGARIAARCEAVLLPEQGVALPPKIHVEATLNGYRKVEFDWTPGDAIDPRVMEPVTPRPESVTKATGVR